jgi:5-formyltetrahydrofolate cyclo-ligase
MLNIPAPPDTAPIIAPEELDLVIVPALAYDSAGYRLGYGGGYYDRYLHDIPAFTVGLARERLIVGELPTEQHDIAVKCVVTEDAVRNFARD